MIKIAAMGAYFYQAGLAFGLLILVSHLLLPADYAAYSLFISMTQFGAIACFEWIRFACSRFYPGQSADSEAVERGTMRVEFAICSGLCLLAALACIGLGVSPVVALVGGLVAIAQGGSELHLTMLRFRQEFHVFSWLQGSRATAVAGGTLAGAVIGHGFVWTASGSLAGYLIYICVALAVPRGPAVPAATWERAVVRKHLVYGGVSASASVAGMLAPLGLKAILTTLLGAQGAAGAMLALDLLQRPFVLIVSALQAIRYPDVVSLFDRGGSGPELRRELGQYYALLASFSLMTAAGIIALLRPVAALVIAADLQAAFLRTAPFLVAISLLRALIQTLLPTPAHLRRHLTSIALLAAIDCLLLNLFALIAVKALGISDTAIMIGGAFGAALATLSGLWVLRSLPFDLPWRPVLAALASMIVPAMAFGMPSDNSYASLAIGVGGAGLFGLMSLYGLYRQNRQQLATQPVST
ncbi:hypothetical protein [Bosea lathyri]|uniref:Membrane protein involved in the export of O-antigen and teichoic acid n=1 Tax=Bosea lathyri TaxID=1036778 RepID=A0A1H5VFL7_9HYPH|nr:hypothetical protein [Bosea lathyri]SEF85287.1 Membrane protein involved in the export of O-antigen and teichoic acid [Bosea lathyri]